MQKNFICKHLVFITLCILIFFTLITIPYELIININNNVLLTQKEIESLKDNKFKLIHSEVMQVSAGNDEKEELINEYSVKFKLFNLINVKKLKVKVASNNEVYLGGSCIGISLKSKGVVIVGSNHIITKHGNVNPFKESGLEVGDVILEIDGVEINSVNDITKVLSNYSGIKPLPMLITRKGNQKYLDIRPAKDIQTSNYKLGLWIRDDTTGVGTITFVDDNTKRFGSLGHAIIDIDTGVKFEVNGGEIYKCNVIGVKQGKKGTPGELMGLFMPGNNAVGTVDKNCNNGVYGYITNEKYLENMKQIEVGGRLTAKPGKAKILTCINGVDVEEFDIEIIKTNYQTKPNEKSMVIKITDSKLINKTGGIVQGMSGSPIVQNGKIIGAVTHVFVNDPTKGFGLYLDWMILE